ncbi:hypothetical protein HY485_04225 [Candidatus Woesearchaeota archaeon]|nr:hypothetical protein [Candidatus Woesearchaeota archaeon]
MSLDDIKQLPQFDETADIHVEPYQEIAEIVLGIRWHGTVTKRRFMAYVKGTYIHPTVHDGKKLLVFSKEIVLRSKYQTCEQELLEDICDYRIIERL